MRGTLVLKVYDLLPFVCSCVTINGISGMNANVLKFTDNCVF